MLTCFAFAAALSAAPMAQIPSLADEVEREARALTAMSQTADFQPADLEDFADDAMALSTALRSAGVTQDLPCIFKGISEDARARAADLDHVEATERAMAMGELRALLDDAILMAPMAEAAALEAQRQD